MTLKRWTSKGVALATIAVYFSILGVAVLVREFTK